MEIIYSNYGLRSGYFKNGLTTSFFVELKVQLSSREKRIVVKLISQIRCEFLHFAFD